MAVAITRSCGDCAKLTAMTELDYDPRLAHPLTDLVKEELGDDPQAFALVNAFLGHNTYQRQFCLELLELARDRSSCSWDLRRLAILMLEHQILKLPLGAVAEFAFLLTELGIGETDGPDGGVSEQVLKEGYSTTLLAGFVREFNLRLSRLNRVHLAIKGNLTSMEALREFIRESRVDCKLSLARYLVASSEVVDRIIGQLNKSTGVKDLTAFNQPEVSPEASRCFERLPRFESEIARALCEAPKIYWVSDATSAEINSLVEYPLNTVVLVVKPPGSHAEFEIKRAGVRGNRPLDVVFERYGYEVPSTHRLHAGSMGFYIRWEAGAAAVLSKIYRLIHQTEAPISRTLSVSTIYTVPVDGQERHILEYFSDFNGTRNPDEVRRAMRQCVEANRDEVGVFTPPALPGDFGLATQFLGQVIPSLSILMDTSSFRLERLESYLSPQGAELYLTQGLKTSYTRSEAKWFADELLDEILGVYDSENLIYENHGQYIDAALSRSDNRARADRNYLSMMRQIGKFWGTLMGMRSHSYGESFVARNVGVKSVFEDGEWKVKVVFLDHDAMFITSVTTNHYHPLSSIPNMLTDERYIMGGHNIRGSVQCLGAIYRVNQTVEAEGYSALKNELGAAHKKARDEMWSNPGLKTFFSANFLNGVRDWDHILVRYLSVVDEPSKVDSWKEETTRSLQEKGYDEGLIREYVKCVEKYTGFLQRYSFIY